MNNKKFGHEHVKNLTGLRLGTSIVWISSGKGVLMRLLGLTSGQGFTMGKGQNWRVVHPDMGASRITLNYAVHDLGNEFVQHVHEGSDDIIVVLEGSVSLRQGERYTKAVAGEAIMIPKGEVHGTVNTGDRPARMVSFQSPPDMALYRGERNRPQGERPIPDPTTVSSVLVARMESGSPDFRKPCDWRRVFHAGNGSAAMELWFGALRAGDRLELEEEGPEGVLVVSAGVLELSLDGEAPRRLTEGSVLFLERGDRFGLACEEAARVFLCAASKEEARA